MRGFTWEGTHGKSLMEELNMELSQVKGGSVKGLIMAAAFIRRATESQPPLTPVDTGNLRASWFVVSGSGISAGRGGINSSSGNPDSSGNKFIGPNAARMGADHASVIAKSQGIVKSISMGENKAVMLGYTAHYSGWVHEMIGAEFNPKNRKGTKRRREGAGAKWLQSAIQNNKSKIVEIVRDNAKVK